MLGITRLGTLLVTTQCKQYNFHTPTIVVTLLKDSVAVITI